MPHLPRGHVRNARALRRALTVFGSTVSAAFCVAFLWLIVLPQDRDQLFCLYRTPCTLETDGTVGVTGMCFTVCTVIGAVLFGVLRIHETVWDRFVLRFQRHFDRVYALPRLLEWSFPATTEQLQALADTVETVPHQAGVIAELFENRISYQDDADVHVDPSYVAYWSAWLTYWVLATLMLIVLGFVLASCLYWALVWPQFHAPVPMPYMYLLFLGSVITVQLSMGRAKGLVRRAFVDALRVLVREDRAGLVDAVTRQIGKLPPPTTVPIVSEPHALVMGASSFVPAFDVFVAGAMSTASGRGRNDTYLTEHERAVGICHALRTAGFTVRSPLAERARRADFIDPATALRLNYDALRKTRCLVVIMTQNVATSAILEAGIMLGFARPIVILHPPGLTLPYLLRQPAQVFPFVRLRMCRTDDEFFTASVEETYRALGRGHGPEGPAPDVRKTA